MKQLNIKIDEKTHLRLKIYAVTKGATMQDLITESIAKLLSQSVVP